MRLLQLYSLALGFAVVSQPLAAASAAKGSPFVDTQGRFTMTLPPGWAFAPQPGDPHGVFFKKVLDGMPANATVRLVAFNTPIELGAFAARIAAASDQEPGFHLLFSEPTEQAGVPALRRRFVTYVNGDARLSKVVEQRILVVGGIRGYVVHAETLAEIFGSFEKDFAGLFASFVPTAGHPTVSAVLSAHRPPRRLEVGKLIGLWEGGGHVLQLSPGSTIILDGLSGSYRLDQGLLDCTFGTSKRLFEVSLEDNVLTLAGGSFGAGQKLTHRAAKAAPEHHH